MTATYQPRYCFAAPPEGYEGDEVAVQLNLTGNEMIAIQRGPAWSLELVGLYNRLPEMSNLSADEEALAELEARRNKGDNSPELIDQVAAARARLDERQEAAQAFYAELDAAGERAALAYGALASKAFGQRAYTISGLTLDFTTAEAARQTITGGDLPEDLVFWLRALPGAALDFEQERIKNGLKKRLRVGTR